MTTIQFGQFDVAFTRYQTKGIGDIQQGLDYEAFYAHIRENLRRQGAETFYRFSFGFEIERRWYESNAPEFKVYPSMCDAMENTRIDIDAKFFKMPYEAFEIRLPKHHIKDNGDAPWLDAILVTSVDEPQASQVARIGGASVAISKTGDRDVKKLVIFLCFETQDGDPGQFNYFKFPLLEGRSIEQTFDSTYMRTDGPSPTLDAQVIREAQKVAGDDKGYWPSRTLYRRVLPIVMGTAFFGIGRDRQQSLVRPEKMPRHERRRIAKETGQRTREVEGRPVFSVGQDVVLPRYAPDLNREKSEIESDRLCERAGCEHRYDAHTAARKGCSIEECGCPAFDTGRHLTHGHIRCGHLHYYCTGPRKNGQPGTDYELRWVDPTVVRKDLPLAPVRTRAIKQPRNEIISADLERLAE